MLGFLVLVFLLLVGAAAVVVTRPFFLPAPFTRVLHASLAVIGIFHRRRHLARGRKHGLCQLRWGEWADCGLRVLFFAGPASDVVVGEEDALGGRHFSCFGDLFWVVVEGRRVGLGRAVRFV